jgi:hypothetical protein
MSRGGDFLKKKTLALSLSVCLLVSIVVGVVAQTFANATTSPPVDKNKYAFGEHGEVIVQFPQPSTVANTTQPSHPTTLRFIPAIFDNRSSFGPSSSMIVQLWIPAANQFVAVAQIVASSNPDLPSYLQTLWNGTPIWNAAMHNIFIVNSQTLNVWRDCSTIVANLTTSVTITLPFNLLVGTAYVAYGNQTFVLPPLALTFIPTVSPSPLHEVTNLLPSPPLSGYTIDITSLMSPAWVRVDVPTWVKGTWLECSGHICTDLVEAEMPPAT